MNSLDDLKNIKQALIDDLKKSITYTPNRNHDIYLIMNRYLSNKVEKEQKENILINLSKCINGQSYEQPKGAIIENYTIDEINELDKLLDKFFEDLKNNPEKIKELTEMLEEEIINLQFKTKEHLLDTWRIEQLCDWYDLACETAISYSYDYDDDCIESEDLGECGMKME